MTKVPPREGAHSAAAPEAVVVDFWSMLIGRGSPDDGKLVGNHLWL